MGSNHRTFAALCAAPSPAGPASSGARAFRYGVVNRSCKLLQIFKTLSEAELFCRREAQKTGVILTIHDFDKKTFHMAAGITKRAVVRAEAADLVK